MAISFIRYNEGSKYYEYDSSVAKDGSGPWLILPLDGSQISSGTIPNVAYKNAANIFTSDQIISKTRPDLKLLHSGTAGAHFFQFLENTAIFSSNLTYDGTNWNLDNTALVGSILYLANDGTLLRYTATAGANPRTLTQVPVAGLNGQMGQVAFPATQNPSANANTLDDYEEGNWTPVIRSDATATGQTYGVQSGYYTKVGNLCSAGFYVALTNKGTYTGNLTIGGLPFVTKSGSGHYTGQTIGYWISLNTAMNWVGLYIAPGWSDAYLSVTTANAVSTLTMTTADLTNTSGFIGSITYRTD